MAPDLDPYAAATEHARAGRFPAAIAAVDEILAAEGETAAALVMKGAFLIEVGQAEAAIAACERAAALDPTNPRAHSNRALALARLGRNAEAAEAYDHALTLDPQLVSALVNRGGVLTDLGRPEAAVESYDRALALDAGLAQAWSNRARALVHLDRHEEALTSADRALALRPAYPKAWVNRGDALHALKRYAPALESYRTAARYEPGSYHAWRSQGTTLRTMGRLAEAVAAFDTADRIDPQTATAAYQRGLTRLLMGEFEAGWRDFLARWRTPGFLATSFGFVTPRVREKLTLGPAAADLAGKRVLLVSEQGIGDQLMFASMLPDLLAVAARVICVCDRRLARLLGASFPEALFFDSRDPVPDDAGDFDVVVAAGDLGAAFRNRLADFPGTPFVQPRAETVRAWAAKLGPKRSRLRVGVSWRGGTKGTNMAGRSIPLPNLRRLLALRDCEFVSLQYGEAAAEVAAAAVDLRLFPAEEIDDFEDLAGLIANLDVVVSVQTAVVHLCGALGKDCVTMVPLRPEWRYGVEGETIPWYRSVRMLRQDATESWAPVIDAAARAVAARAGR